MHSGRKIFTEEWAESGIESQADIGLLLHERSQVIWKSVLLVIIFSLDLQEEWVASHWSNWVHGHSLMMHVILVHMVISHIFLFSHHIVHSLAVTLNVILISINHAVISGAH